jgi:hypothetical protein
MAGRVKALVLPIWRRHWLCHAWQADPAAAAAATAAAPRRSWRDGQNLEERFGILADSLADRLSARLLAEWRKLEAAAEGSLRGRAYRAAQAVLAREPPEEAFFKAVPSEPGAELEVAYPASLSKRLVRRRLRAAAAAARRRHRRLLLGWALAAAPQAPLLLTPLPNVTVYYTGYRIYSHWRALQGARALDRAFAAADSAQLTATRDALLRLQAARPELVFPPDEWPARLIRREARYLDIFDRLRRLQLQRRLEALARAEEAPPAAAILGLEPLRGAGSGGAGVRGGGSAAKGGAGGGAAPEPAAPALPAVGLRLLLRPSAELDALARPAERSRAPLGDEEAHAVGAALGAPGLLGLVARARKRAVGSMFPVARTDAEG